MHIYFFVSLSMVHQNHEIHPNECPAKHDFNFFQISCLQTWADAFRGSPELKDVEKVYQDLKSKGIEFPMTDLDSLAPIHTPARVRLVSGNHFIN